MSISNYIEVLEMGLQRGSIVQGLRGRYKVETEIGSGGLGKVWKGSTEDGNPVAIKEPLSLGHADQVRLNFEKLKIEAAILERLTCVRPLILSTHGYSLDPAIAPHIVRFVDVDSANVPKLLVIEFLPGKSVDAHLRAAPLDTLRIEQYVTTTLKIVGELHRNNILHRDISPHNLISVPNPAKDPVLIDFGTVKEGFNQLSSLRWSQIIKPGYSAPELSMGLASPSSDIYAVGATMLFMFTGVNPRYLLDSSGEFDETKPQFRRVPPNRLAIIKKAMSYLPANRYQTAEDMLNALAGRFQELTLPHIIAGGVKYPVTSSLVIGVAHECGAACLKKGFSRHPDIALVDPQRYISRHHARVWAGPNGAIQIEDLRSVSGTAIRHATGTNFENLQPGRPYKLMDGDVVALAYSPKKGPYMTISFSLK